MVSLSIDEFHIFKAAHRSWTLLALVRISNSRCYASRAQWHTVSKNLFFLELPIFPERPICTGWPKLFSKEIACEVIQIHICYCTIFYISRDHYAEPKQCFGSYVMTKKNAFCIDLISLSFTGLLCQYTKKLFETFFEIHYYTFKCICCT